MFKRLFAFVLIFAGSLAANAQGTHRISQVVGRAATGVDAQVVPYAKVLVCVANTACSQIASVYTNLSLVEKAPNPVIADANGNYNYYVPLGCYDEKISAPGTTPFTIFNICNGVGGVTQIIAGNNITISPSNGIGQVTINASGGGSCNGCVLANPSTAQTILQPFVNSLQTTLAVNSLNNFYLASQFQTGSGNNGIANTAALNTGSGLTTMADPGYPSTEQIPGLNTGPFGGNIYTATPTWPTFTHVTDNRVGRQIDAFTESGSSQYVTSPAWQRWYFNTYNVTGNTLQFEGFLDQSDFFGTGQQITGFGAPLKSYWFGSVANEVSTSQGQKLARIENVFNTGIGDSIAHTRFSSCNGGLSANSDEGCHDHDDQIQENNNVFQGTISGNPGTGATTIQVTPTRDQGYQGDGLFLIDTQSADVTSGTPPSEYTNGNVGFPPLSGGGSFLPVPSLATFVGTSFTPSTNLMICSTATGGTCPTGSNPTGRIDVISGTYSPGTLTVQVVTSAPGLPTGYLRRPKLACDGSKCNHTRLGTLNGLGPGLARI